MRYWKSVIAAAAVVLLAGTGAELRAQSEQGVLVELFTSQGCSSCPPADALMKDLAERDDIIALSLHVDYWDYLGWADSFASPVFTARQKRYARAMGERMVYTPQMIIGGQDHVVGTKPMKITNLIARHKAGERKVRLQLSRESGTVDIEARAERAFARPAIVQLMRYMPRATVEIGRGENAGRALEYTNIVTDLRVIGRWDGADVLRISAPISGDRPVVVLIQHDDHGAVLAAARLR